MKKWAVVDCSTKKVLAIYDSEEVQPKRYGGPWGDPDICEHMEVREDAYDLEFSEVEPGNAEYQDGTSYVANESMTEAKDPNGDPILDSNGDPVMIQDYDPVPIMKTVKMIIPKAQE